VPEPRTVAGENVAVTPFGRPETLRLTVPEKPPNLLTEAATVLLFPLQTDVEPGAERVKLAVTIRVTVADFVVLPLTPRIDRV
jgi:hypothetical protein